jgi:hypothetical protein
MEARNAGARDPVSDGSLGAARGSGNRRLRGLDWQSLPCVKLPQPSFRRDEWRRKRRLPAAKDTFEVQAAGWRLNSVEELPAALRPGPRLPPLSSARVRSAHAG